jgi:NAD(P)H-flavin reductase
MLKTRIFVYTKKKHILGPYGTPVDLTQYVHVVLIAGGIGITPIYSCYRQIYLQMIAKCTL